MQSTIVLIGPSSGILITLLKASIETLLLTTQAFIPPSTWNEAKYNKAQVWQRNTLKMGKTSMREGLDS